MGVLIVESSRISTDSEEVFVANDVEDGERKKRRSRKSKPTLSACSSLGAIYSEASASLHHVVSNELLNEGNGDCLVHEQMANENLQNQQSLPPEIDYHSRRTFFPPHKSADAVSKALERGELLKALFRVNVYNRLEAYCKIDGVQTDVLISGVVAQNRAVEGDTVAIVIDPPSLWPRLKGSSDTLNNSAPHSNSLEVRGKSNIIISSGNNTVFHDDVARYEDDSSSRAAALDNGHSNAVLDNGGTNGYGSVILFEKLCSLTSLFPSKRPTGKVVAVIEKSPRRDNIVGFLGVKQWVSSRESKKKNLRKNKPQSDLNQGYILLTPTDQKLTKMMVHVRSLPEIIKKRLEASDLTIESDLVAAKIVDWPDECNIPYACVVRVFGRGNDVKAQIAAILYENAIDDSEFSPEVFSCLPHTPWEVPHEELESRVDLRNLCVFTIDPSTATDLDDALSIEKLPNGVFRVGVHIADVSYFVLPDTALDIDAQFRSTTVYLQKSKLPMLPQMLSDNVASLNPGVDRLTFSIFWDIKSKGEVVDRWIGRTVIRSCGKLSYEHAQEIIDGSFNFLDLPNLYGRFQWEEVISSVKGLHEISKVLRENRFKSGALSLDCPKVAFLYDEDGIPCDSLVSGRGESNFLVEEFMLLANVTAAEVITRTYPSCALLRRHPEPNARKLREFEAFCYKHGLRLDISSSSNLHRSLERIRAEHEKDSVFLDILMSYAARPMQLAAYFCSGDFEDVGDYSHYGLAVPLYTHFTSPLRRYPDIVVHRTLAAALEAENVYMKKTKSGEGKLSRCFSGVCLNKDVMESVEAKEALSFAGLKCGVVGPETLTSLASHCNERKLATRRVKDSTDKLYIWLLLKRKEILYSEARVLGLGPKFMSVYIPKLAMERRIHYDEVEGVMAEWLETTSTLVLSQCGCSAQKQGMTRKSRMKTMDEMALIVCPSELEKCCKGISDITTTNKEPLFFPVTVGIMSTIPVAVHAVGGDDGPLDVVARLYVSSYFQ